MSVGAKGKRFAFFLFEEKSPSEQRAIFPLDSRPCRDTHGHDGGKEGAGRVTDASLLWAQNGPPVAKLLENLQRQPPPSTALASCYHRAPAGDAYIYRQVLTLAQKSQRFLPTLGARTCIC